MEDNEEYEEYIHYIMSAVGGFLGAYALLNRCEIFGSSQTSNMIYIVTNLLGKNFNEFFIRCLALMIYMSGIAFTVIITKYTKVSIHAVSITLDIIVVFILGFLPQKMNAIIALYPIFFVMAVQWNSFYGAQGFASSTIFSTNNIRQATISYTEYVCDKDKSHLRKAKFYTYVLFSYHIGVGISYLSYKTFGIKGAWICSIPLLIALLIKYIGNDIQRKRTILNKTTICKI